MDYVELLLGFDAREMWHYENVGAMGTRTATGIGFLRDEVKKGLSIDPSIWGSVFNTGDCPALMGEERRRVGLGTLTLPEWIGSNRPLWENLSELEKYIKEHDSEIIKPYWIIAVTCLSNPKEVKDIPTEWPSFEPTIPPFVLHGWKLLGFDIADRGGETHLTGIGFRGDEQYLDSLCKRWGPRLSEYHLFKELVDALEYKDFETHEDPDHSPYFAYGIWLIREIDKQIKTQRTG